MSYLRYGELSEEGASDVYVFMDVDGYLVCHSCLLLSAYYGPSFEAHSTQAMIGHLEQHRAAGHCVPHFDEVVTGLWADDAENFPDAAR